MEDNGHKWRSVVRQGCKRKTALCWNEEGEPWNDSDLTTVFLEAVYFLQACAKGVPSLRHGTVSPSHPCLTTGLHLGLLSSTSCSSTQTRPLPIPPPSDWPRPFLSQTFTSINTLAIPCQLFFLFKRHMKIEQCSETSAQKVQMPANHPKERIKDCTSFDHPNSN